MKHLLGTSLLSSLQVSFLIHKLGDFSDCDKKFLGRWDDF